MEVQRLCISCQAVGGDEGLSEYWKDKVRQKAPSSGSIKAELVLTPTSSTPAAKKFVLNLLSQTKNKQLANLLQFLIPDVSGSVEPSSVDRDEEGAFNTLKESACVNLYGRMIEQARHASMEEIGFVAQMRAAVRVGRPVIGHLSHQKLRQKMNTSHIISRIL